MTIDLSEVLAGIDAADTYTRLAERELARCARDLAFLGWELPDYRVEWSTRGHTAGWCMYPTHERGMLIRFNALLAAREGDRFVETVAHEYAHAACFVHYGPRVHHGYEWRSLMNVFGYAGARCHNYATTSAAAMRRKGL